MGTGNLATQSDAKSTAYLSKYIVCGEQFIGLNKTEITIRKLRTASGERYEPVVYTDGGHVYYPGKLSETPQEAHKSIVIIDMLED